MKRACRILLLLLPLLSLSSGWADEPATTVPDQSVTPIAASAQIKTIGVIGGISWVSSAEYYRQLNEGIAARLGGLHSAPVLMYSIWKRISTARRSRC